MQKQTAIELLGGTVKLAALAIGVTYQAVNKWPEKLTPRVADRVEAAISRAKTQSKSKPRLLKDKVVL